MLKLHKSTGGETVIEVMIALTIMGLVLGFSAASASRSLRASQDAQERTVAAGAAASLLEIIKTYATRAETNPSLQPLLFPANDQTICLSTDLDDINNTVVPVLSPDPICESGIYTRRVIVHPVAGSAPPAFEYTAEVSWDSAINGSRNRAVLIYKWVRVPLTP